MSDNIDIVDERGLQSDDNILRYLKGEMSVDEERAFLTELQSNSELKSKTVAMARLVKGLREVGDAEDSEIKGALRSLSRDDIQTIARSTTKVKKQGVLSLKSAPVWISIAASIALVIWSGIGLYNRQQTIGLANEYANAFNSSSMIVRGEHYDTETEANLSRLFANIANAENLDNTISELSQCWELSTSEFYNEYTNYSAEIGWNLAIGYMKKNDRRNAKIILSELITSQSESSAIGEKSKELLEKIR